ncbi:hypothetical protein BCR33DRAFT_768968 [Rhizoclosmatium globosum]|uniref:Transmembrane protein n=1 Tax=Rhizoclosmatium globosum TaxID=329046 RepID=A0A1Y2BVM4_9FUNG|nr:hypothetical protein BCR33DRAFT_768968 [Rhizoclosmatium globosum]|eukprot:ORY38822.1 hypothetical protein BCR33DRAFT_768968 [Rhizoclosmatium globosum]
MSRRSSKNYLPRLDSTVENNRDCKPEDAPALPGLMSQSGPPGSNTILPDSIQKEIQIPSSHLVEIQSNEVGVTIPEVQPTGSKEVIPERVSTVSQSGKKRSLAELKTIMRSAVQEKMQENRAIEAKHGASRRTSVESEKEEAPKMERKRSSDMISILKKAVETKAIFHAMSSHSDENSDTSNRLSVTSAKGPRRVSMNNDVEYSTFSPIPEQENETSQKQLTFMERLSSGVQKLKQASSVEIAKEPHTKKDVQFDRKESTSSSGSGGNLKQTVARSKSLASTNSMNGGLNREITETWSTIIKKMKWSILSVLLNGCLIVLLDQARSGVVISIQASLVNQFGGIILLVVLLVCNVVCIWSLSEAGSCVAGFHLSKKHGFSFAVCGFMQASSFQKVTFSQSLSLTSKYRKMLSRAAFLWVALEAIKVLVPISAIALSASRYASYNDVSDCIYFVQGSKTKPVDRNWPTLDAESGVAEYVFGSSLGIMRSETSVNITTAMFPPALISVVNNGDVIQGLGVSVDISTSCKCSKNLTSAGLVAAGVDPSHVDQVLQEYLNLNRMPGITFGVITNNDSIVISNLFSGYGLCAGLNPILSQPLVCSTTMNNHQQRLLEISFMTDGTTASIAPNVVSSVAVIGPADVKTWLSFAVNALLNGPVSSYLTPATVPGSLGPLLWWTTPNLIGIDRALVEAGMETMYAILFKGAIQRTYIPKGTQCPRKNLISSTQSRIAIMQSGYIASVVFLAIQMFASIISILAFSLWLFSPSPIGPAVRACQEPVYLITLLQSSANIGMGLNDLCNAETYAIWQRLDVKCRIGESITTIEEDIGKIIVEKPSLVRALKNGRRYY